MEKWIEICEGSIPADSYFAEVKNSEETGLVIKLIGKVNRCRIIFGAILGVRLIDEGMAQNIYSSAEIEKYKETKFANTIYEIQNGEFLERMKTYSAGYLDVISVHHFAVITSNHIIEIISKWAPEIVKD